MVRRRPRLLETLEKVVVEFRLPIDNKGRFDEERAYRMSCYLARHLSWQYGRKVARPAGNLDGLNSHWIHMPFEWADTGEYITCE